MKKIIALGIALLLTTGAQAATPSHLAKINKFFEVTQMQKQYETGLIAGFEGATRMADLSAMSPDERAKLEKATKRVKEFLLAEMGWPKVKDDLAELYAKHFSEEDLDKITKLLDNETGRMFITKQIALMPESMTYAQTKVQALSPKIATMMQEEMSKP